MRCGLVVLMMIFSWTILRAEPLPPITNQVIENEIIPDSTNLQAMLDRADSLAMRGELSEAQLLLKEALSQSASFENDSLTLAIQFQIANNYLDADKPDSAEVLVNELMAQPLADIDSTRAINIIGKAYRYQGRFNDALEKHKLAKARVDSVAYPALTGNINFNIGVVYSEKGEFGTALNYYLSSMERAEAAGDSTMLATVYNSIGLMYINTGQPEQGRFYFERAIQINRDLNNRVGLLRAMSNHAIALQNLGEYSEAINQYEEALQLHEDVREDVPPFRILYNLGQLNKEIGNLDEAENYYQQSLGYSEEAQVFQGMIYNYGGLANVAELRNNYPKARDFYGRALNVAQDIGANNLQMDALNSLYTLEKELDNTADALAYYEQYVALDDSLDEIAQQQALAENETQLSLRQQEQINELLEEKQRRQEARINTQNWLIAVGVGIIIIILLLLFLLYRYSREKKKANAELQKQHARLEDLNAVKDKLLAVIAHDLRSPLAAMHGMLNLMQEKGLTEEEVDLLTAELRVSLNQYLIMLDNLLVWARGQMDGLKVNLENVDPYPIVERVYDNYQVQAQKKGIELINEVEESLSVRADKNLLELILRNLIANSIKFSGEGNRITVLTREDPDGVIFEVADTGIGMPPELVEKIFTVNGKSRLGTSNEKGSGLGLKLCKEFVEKQQGEIDVESSEGEGTTMRFTLPKA